MEKYLESKLPHIKYLTKSFIIKNIRILRITLRKPDS